MKNCKMHLTPFKILAILIFIGFLTVPNLVSASWVILEEGASNFRGSSVSLPRLSTQETTLAATPEADSAGMPFMTLPAVMLPTLGQTETPSQTSTPSYTPTMMLTPTPVPTGDLDVWIFWVDEEPVHPDVQIALHQVFSDGTTVVYQTADIPSGVTSHRWVGLPLVDEFGDAISYNTVHSGDDPKGYMAVSHGSELYYLPTALYIGYVQWVGGEDLFRPATQLQLLRNGDPYGTPLYVPSSTTRGVSQTSVEWDGVPIVDETGQPYVYSVTQVGTPTGYYKIEESMIVRNVYLDDSVDATAKIVWENGPAQHPEVTLMLQRSVPNSIALNVYPAQIENGVTSFTWNELRRVDAMGNLYTYRIMVQDVPENYSVVEDGMTARFTYHSPLQDVTGRVHWTGGGSQIVRPETMVQLELNGEPFDEPRRVESSAADAELIWEGVPVTDENGTPYVYTLSQPETPDGYKAAENGLTVTNTFVPAMAVLQANVVWCDGQLARDPIQLRLMRRTKDGGDEIVALTDANSLADLPCETANPVTVTPAKGLNEPESASLSVLFCVPGTDVDAVPIEYYVEEVGYDSENEAELWINNSSTATAGIAPAVLTKTYQIPAADPKIMVNWVGGAFYPHPDLTIELVQGETVIGSPFTLAANGEAGEGWSSPISVLSSFSDFVGSALPATDQRGEAISYSVRLVSTVPNYVSKANEMTLTNTFVSEKKVLHGTHSWLDGEEVRESVMLQLMRAVPGSPQRVPAVISAQDIVEGADCALLNPIKLVPPESGEDTLLFSWCVDAYDSEGREIAYQVAPLNLPSTWVFEVPDAEDPLTVRSRYVSPTVSPKGRLIWDGGGKLARPGVTLELVADSEATGRTIQIAAESYPTGTSEVDIDWCGRLRIGEKCDIPLTDKHGEAILYTFHQVQTLENYLSEEIGTTVHNTFVSSKQPITASLNWEGGVGLRQPVTIALARIGADGESEIVELTEHDQIEGVDCEAENPVTFDADDYQDAPVSSAVTATWCVDSHDQDGARIRYQLSEIKETPNDWTLSLKTLNDPFTVVSRFVPPTDVLTGKLTRVNGEMLPLPNLRLELRRNRERIGQPFVVTPADVAEDGTFTIDGCEELELVGNCGIPLTDFQGVPYDYSLAAVETPRYYTVQADGMTVTQTYQPPKAQVMGTVIWKDGQLRREPVTVELVRIGADGAEETIQLTDGDRIADRVCAAVNPLILTPVAELNQPSAVQMNAVWCVDKTTKQGDKIKYALREVESSKVDSLSPVGIWITESENALTLVKRYEPAPASLNVTVNWIGGAELVHPSVVLELRRNGQPVGEPLTIQSDGLKGTVRGEPISLGTLSDAEAFRELTVTDRNGVEAVYTVQDMSPEMNYTAKSDGLTMTYTYRSEKIAVEAELVRKNGALRLENTEITLMRSLNGGEAEVVPLTTQDQIAGERCALTNPVVISAPGAELAAERSDRIVWCVDETDVEGVPYAYSIVKTSEGSGEWVADDAETSALRLAETYQPPMIQPTFRVSRIGGTKLKWPELKLRLKQDGAAFDERTVAGSDETVQRTNEEILLTWDEVPETDETGRPYRYTIESVEIPANYRAFAETGISLTYLYVPVVGDVSGVVSWVGGAEPRPTVVVQLWRRTEGGVTEVIGSASLRPGLLSYTWTDQPATDADGNLYTYSLVNLNPVPDYTVKEEGTRVTYHYRSPVGDIEGGVQWAHGTKLIRPQTELQLLQNGRPYGDPVLTEAVATTGVMNQSVTWRELPTHDEDGRPYIYTIDEAETPKNYVKSQDGLTVLNTYVAPRGRVEGKIVWDGKEGTVPTVRVILRQTSANGNIVDSEPIEIKNGTLKALWEDIPETDEEGEPIVYSLIPEKTPSNYVAESDGLTLVFRYEPELYQGDGVILAEVIWVDIPEPHPALSITLQRSLNEAAANLETVTLQNGTTTHRWENLPNQTDLDEPYLYQLKVTNPNPEKYKVEVDGFTVRISPLRPATPSISYG